MKFKPTYIEWEDAMEYQTGWIEYEKAIKEAEEPIISIYIGFIIHETKEYILVASQYIEDKTIDIGSPFKIPKSLIRKQKEIKL